MDLRATVEAMFPNENVSPTFESYDMMAKYWRGKKSVPSLKEIQAYADAIPIVPVEKTIEEKVEDLIVKVQALEDEPK